MPNKFIGLHENTGPIYIAHPDYQTVFDIILEPKRGGEIVGIKPASGGHHVNCRVKGSKSLQTITIVNTAPGLSAARNEARRQFPNQHSEQPGAPKTRKGLRRAAEVAATL